LRAKFVAGEIAFEFEGGEGHDNKLKAGDGFTIRN
jgi:hypothetical protein